MALLGFCCVIAAGCGLWWANRTGLPDSWRGEIENALAAQGIHAEVAGLRYIPLRGIQADEVVVYGDITHQRVVARASEVMVDIDRTKLARGDFRVERLDLKNGSLSLPANPDDPESKILEIKNASGRLLMPGGRRFELREVSGEIRGIKIEFDAFLLGYRQRLAVSMEDYEKARLYRQQLLTRIISLLEPWQFDPETPPILRIRVEGDLDDPTSVRADLQIRAEGLERGSIRISKLEADGEIRGRILILDHLRIEDGGGSLEGRMEYDMATRSGYFDTNSNLSVPTLLREFKVASALKDLDFQSRPEISLHGSFDWPVDAPFTFQLTGHLAAKQVKYRSYTADLVESELSWNGSNLFLENLAITRPDGILKGRILAKPERVDAEFSTDLKLRVWRHLFDNHPLGPVLADFSDRDDSEVDANINIRFSPTDPHDWAAHGMARATNMSYKGTPFRKARVDMTLDHDALDFTNGSVTFDYSNYALRKAHDGPRVGNAAVKRVRYDREPATLTFEGIEGKFWPAPVLRMFLPDVADHLEEYRFHTPPQLNASGVIGLNESSASKTNFAIHGESSGSVSYKFAGTDLLVTELSTNVRVLPKSTEVRDLSFEVFDGPVRGKFDVLPEAKGQRVKGELDWTRLSLPEISHASGFDKKAKGVVTGRIDFDYYGVEARGLNGTGLIALEESELFSVPIFGPLSPVLSVVLGKRKAGFQQAREAFCTFSVKNGVLRTTDFLTTTPSLVFTGDARANLNKLTLDMTIRMNARGLFGVITLPLRPFYGLFQFRGKGPLREPVWDNVMFTSPPESEEQLLMAPPKAISVKDRTKRDE